MSSFLFFFEIFVQEIDHTHGENGVRNVMFGYHYFLLFLKIIGESCLAFDGSYCEHSVERYRFAVRNAFCDFVYNRVGDMVHLTKVFVEPFRYSLVKLFFIHCLCFVM